MTDTFLIYTDILEIEYSFHRYQIYITNPCITPSSIVQNGCIDVRDVRERRHFGFIYSREAVFVGEIAS